MGNLGDAQDTLAYIFIFYKYGGLHFDGKITKSTNGGFSALFDYRRVAPAQGCDDL